MTTQSWKVDTTQAVSFTSTSTTRTQFFKFIKVHNPFHPSTTPWESTAAIQRRRFEGARVNGNDDLSPQGQWAHNLMHDRSFAPSSSSFLLVARRGTHHTIRPQKSVGSITHTTLSRVTELIYTPQSWWSHNLSWKFHSPQWKWTHNLMHERSFVQRSDSFLLVAWRGIHHRQYEHRNLSGP